MRQYINNFLQKISLGRPTFLKIVGVTILSIALDLYPMEKNEALNQMAPHSGQARDIASLFTNPHSAGTVVSHCGNNYDKTNMNDNRNTCNPINNNIITFSFMGAGLSTLIDPERYRGLCHRATQFAGALINLLINNKKTTASSVIATLYIVLNSRLMYLNAKLNHASCWSQWRSTLAIEELYLIPRHTLYNDLLTNIQTKYTNFRNFRDSLAPLSNFLEDAEQEEAYIKEYQSIIKALKQFHISSIVFYSPDFYKQISKRSSRLLFLKSAFLNWYAERKLSTSEKEVMFRRFPSTKQILDTSSQDYGIDTLSILPLLPEESTELILENIIEI